MAHSTNYYNTFITVASDARASAGTEPPPRAKPSVASLIYGMIYDNPYRYTSDDVLFAVHAERKAIVVGDRDAAREQYFAKAQPCLRACPLGKTYGWGVHFDGEGRVALYGMETDAYAAFVAGERRTADGESLTLKAAMRSRR